ncbi:LapA family protein [Flavobacterium sp. W21_SRS_FM6]|uniref:LapA family protein n=1 Tax=Flavobacterium sp. W21_SRS_FM6 TaxID=3240268 RepID=UPI003F92D729
MKVKGLLILIAILILLVIASFIGSYNGHLVLLHYLIAKSEIKLSYVLAASFLLGVFVCLLSILPYILRLKWKMALVNRQNKKLQQRNTDS